jgi:hypothetical protein
MRFIIYRSAVTFLLAVSSNVYAQWDFDNSGGRNFDMRQNTQKSVKITLESVAPSEIRKACDRKSRELGNGGFSYEPIACAFWTGKTCHIIVPHKVDMRTIGHEVMHCFQGDWHKQPN